MNETYRNPVLKRSSPDPFVFKHRGEYWCVSTNSAEGERKFEMLRSPDLIRWEVAGGALDPLPASFPDYWAPEITYYNGTFYLYYSAGAELTGMRLRVATSDQPQGPYRDTGRELTSGPFAIDPHVFIDEDGSWWMFYATDFPDHIRPGTGAVVDRMLDPFTLEGRPHPVALARYEWQVYDPARAEKGGVKWHTVEGSFVLKRKGRFYHMFSGGNWTNPTYGVAYAATGDLRTRVEWEQPLDGERTPLLLCTVAGQVTGPGHCSVVRGPDNVQLYCAYHRWEDGARVLSIDPLDFAGDRLIVLGPSSTAQPVPNKPADREVRARAGAAWELATPQITFEVTMRAAQPERGWYGVRLQGGPRQSVTVGIRERDRALVMRHARAEEHLHLPGGFDARADHLLRIELDGLRCRLMLDTIASRWDVRLPFEPSAIALFDERAKAEFSAAELTAGWQELFDGPEEQASELGWQGDPGWLVAGGELRSPPDRPDWTMIAKETPGEEYELVINARLVDVDAGGGYGFVIAMTPESSGPMIILGHIGGGWELTGGDDDHEETWQLPRGFDPLVTRQFRCRAGRGRVTVALEGTLLGELPLRAGGQFVGIVASEATVAIEMVRVTSL